MALPARPGETTNVKIPASLNIHACNECGAVLSDEDFYITGVLIRRRGIFFDYKCPSCSNVGRYVFELKDGISIYDGLRSIASMLEKEGNVSTPNSQKENIVDQLNSIVGVMDLLKLGGANAPTEPTRHCCQE
jgi:ribosomal protein S27E